jgi:hypothetical protein
MLAMLNSSFGAEVFPSRSHTLFLDLDKSSFYGQDANDVLTVLQMDDRQDLLESVVPLLINPAMVKAVKEVERLSGPARVVIYTAKGNMPGCIPEGHPLKATNQELYLPVGSTMHDVPADLNIHQKHIFQRLIRIRDAISKCLGRGEAGIEAIVTASMTKSVAYACCLLKPAADVDTAYLFDDRPDLDGQYHVIKVDPFNAVSKERKQEIDTLLCNFRMSGDAADFAATSAPPHLCLGEGNRVVVNLSVQEGNAWRTPFLYDKSVDEIFKEARARLEQPEDTTEVDSPWKYDPWGLQMIL